MEIVWKSRVCTPVLTTIQIYRQSSLKSYEKRKREYIDRETDRERLRETWSWTSNLTVPTSQSSDYRQAALCSVLCSLGYPKKKKDALQATQALDKPSYNSPRYALHDLWQASFVLGE